MALFQKRHYRSFSKKGTKIVLQPLSCVYRFAKFDVKFINFFARLLILFYRSPMYETFWTENKLK